MNKLNMPSKKTTAIAGVSAFIGLVASRIGIPEEYTNDVILEAVSTLILSLL